MKQRFAFKPRLVRSKVARWSLLIGAVLGVGLIYAYGRRNTSRQASSILRGLPDALSSDDSRLSPADDELLLAALDDDVEELVDLDAIEPTEPFDAVAPEDLAVEWLSRATQTLGVPTTEVSEDFDELDPAGRPTDPPSRRG